MRSCAGKQPFFLVVCLLQDRFPCHFNSAPLLLASHRPTGALCTFCHVQFFLRRKFGLDYTNLFYREDWDIKLAECVKWLVEGCQQPKYKRNKNGGKLASTCRPASPRDLARCIGCADPGNPETAHVLHSEPNWMQERRPSPGHVAPLPICSEPTGPLLLASTI